MVATCRSAVAAQIDPSHSPGGASVLPPPIWAYVDGFFVPKQHRFSLSAGITVATNTQTNHATTAAAIDRICSVHATRPNNYTGSFSPSGFKEAEGGLYVSLVFLKIFLKRFFQTNYLNIHRTDLYKFYRDGRNLSEDKSHFFYPARDVAMAANVLLTEPTPYFSSRYNIPETT